MAREWPAGRRRADTAGPSPGRRGPPGKSRPPYRWRENGQPAEDARIQQARLQGDEAAQGRAAHPVVRGRTPRAVLAVDEGLQLVRHHLGVTVALAALAAPRVLGGRVFGDAADTRVVDAHHDQRLDGAAPNQLVRRDIGAPILAAEGRVGIEKILPVLQIKHRAGGGARFVSGRKIDDDIARRGEIPRRETGMQTDPPLVFGSIVGQRTSVSHSPRTCPYRSPTARMARGCKDNTSSGTARRFTAKWSSWPLATAGFPCLCFRLPAAISGSTKTATW